MGISIMETHAIRPEQSQTVDFSLAYASLELFSGPIAGQDVEVDCGAYGAKFRLDWDVSKLFPYFNAVVHGAQFYETPVYIKFILDDHLCAFYPTEGAFTPVRDFGTAVSFLDTLCAFVMDIHRRRADIIPNHRKYKPVSVLDIYKLLPGTNCRMCGFATCMAFAGALSRKRTSLDGCPYLGPPVEEKAVYPVLDAQGNCIRTVALDIDTEGLRNTISRNRASIQTLESRLADFEHRHNGTLDTANAALPTPLTQREIQVLERVAGGATNKEIAKALHISEHTVKSHVIHIFNKLGVNDRTQASVWAASHGLH